MKLFKRILVLLTVVPLMFTTACKKESAPRI